MFKTIRNIAVATMLAVLLLTACGSTTSDDGGGNNNDSYGDTEAITFSEPVSSDRRQHGTEMIAQVNRRNYHFTIADEAYAKELASQFEAVIYMFDEFLDEDRFMQIIFTEDEEHYSISTAITHNLIINPYDPTTNGWFVYSMALGYIPMWLSAGMETVARGLDFSYPLSALCEMYFAPFSWGTTQHRQAISTTYQFVSHLIENGYLVELLELYISSNTDDANLLAAEKFYLFSGYLLDVFFGLEFSGTSFHVTANTDMAFYTFEFPAFYHQIQWPDTDVWYVSRRVLDIDYMDKARLLRSVAIMDDSIMFTKHWFAEFIDFEFTPIITSVPMEIIMGAGAWAGRMMVPISGISQLTVHEATHVISSALGDTFLPFEEGLAMVLQSKHSFFDRDRFGVEYQTWAARVEAIISAMYNAGVFESYAVAEAVRDFLIADFEQGVIFEHFLAYIGLNTPEMSVFPPFRPWPGTPPEIHSYITSSSFVRYLIDTYGAEKYMEVFFNTDRFQRVYGVSLEAMLDEWMEFLSINANEFLYAAMGS